MDLTDVFDLVIEAVVFLQDSFDSLKVTIFDRPITFTNLFCVIIVYKLINFIVYGDDEE